MTLLDGGGGRRGHYGGADNVVKTRTPVLIAGPNLTVDRTMSLPVLRPGEVLRCERVVVTPGGKGLNVARAAGALGAPAALVAFLPGHTGRAVGALVEEEGVALRPVPVGGEVRSTAVVLEADGRTTVINEPGPALGPEDWAAYEGALAVALEAHGVLVCSGSVPPAAPRDAYGRLTTLARAAGRRALVDAAGETLAAALPARPDVITPNLAEAEGVLGRGGAGAEAVDAAPDARPRALAAAEALLERGPRAAVVTAAGAGAAVAAAGVAPAWLPAPAVRVRNPIGAGDAFLAGLAAALERGERLVDAARAGVATGAASVEVATAGVLDAPRARALLAEVIAEPA